MADLISLARAKYNLNNLTTTSAEDTTLAALISACSRAIEKHCRRHFPSQTHDEIYRTMSGDKLLLNDYPIVSIQRVATHPTTILTIANQSSANQRATVEVTATGLVLTRVASGIVATDTSVTWSSYTTVLLVKNAVNALGNGWMALAAGGYGDWPSSDLRSPQGALNAARVFAPLRAHVRELSNYEVDAERGWLVRRGGESLGGSIRVSYTAGYATVPEDVQEACAEWVAALFWQTRRDPGLLQEALTGAVHRSSVLVTKGFLPHIHALLQPYRRVPITAY